MVIAINTKYFLELYQQDFSRFIYECVSRIAIQNPEHKFIFFSDTEFNSSFNFPKNIIPVVPKFKAILPGIFYRIKIISLLKKYQADIFLNADGFCSLFAGVPQCFIVQEPKCFFDKRFTKKNQLFLYKKLMSFFLKKAEMIITESHFSKEYLIKKYKTNNDKIDVVYNRPGDFLAPLEWEEREKIKSQYAGGNEYFIFYGDASLPDLLNLLKGFSHFKKWQKSNMQLLIIEKNKLPVNFTKNLNSFKYKADVKLLYNLSHNELTKIIAASYSMIYFPVYENFKSWPLEVMSCRVPVITSKINSVNEMCSDAILYVDFNDFSDIAEKLTLIFKDEKLRKQLIEKGIKCIEKYNPEKTSELLWHCLLKARPSE